MRGKNPGVSGAKLAASMRPFPIFLGLMLATTGCPSSVTTPQRPSDEVTFDAGAGPAEARSDARSDAMPMNMDPNAEAPRFTPGPALTPSTDLVAWLDQQGNHLVRLPFTLVLSGSGSVATAAIGVNREPDAVTVTLSDLQMGISLKDRLRKVCKPGGTCAVWLIGTWAAGAARLDVRTMDGTVADPTAATHAEVEVR